MPLTNTLTDNFNDNSVDAAKWTLQAFSGGTVAETNQRIEMLTGIAGTDSALDSVADPYSLVGSTMGIKLVDAGNQALTSLIVKACRFGAAGGSVYFQISNGNISAFDGTTTQGTITYNSTNHLYLRLRENAGTLFWETSADSNVWAVLYSVANPFSLTTSTFLEFAIESGVELSTTTVIVDDFNILADIAVPNGQRIVSNLPTSVREVKKLPSVLTATANLPTSTSKVTVLTNALTMTANLPAVTVSAGGAVNATFNASALTIQPAVTTPTPKVNIFPSAQSVLSQLAAPSILVSKLTSALSAVLNLPTVTAKITVLPNTLNISANQPTVILSGSSTTTVIVGALIIQSSLTAPSISVGSGATVIVNALTMTSSLQTGSKSITKLPSGMTLASVLGGVTPNVARDISAFQLIASLPGVTLTGGSTSKTVQADALTIQGILATPNIAIFPNIFKRYSKHLQPKNITKNTRNRIDSFNLFDDCVGQWHMNEDSWNGTTNEVIDSSDYNNHGVSSGGATTSASGKINRAGNFDGVNDYVNIPTSSSLDFGTGDFTLTAWVFPLVSTAQRLINKFNQSITKGYIFDINTTTAGNLRIRIDDGVADLNFLVAAGIAVNEWQFVAVTVKRGDASGLIFYRNAAQVGPVGDLSTSTASLNVTENIGIGNIPSTVGSYFNGRIDEVGIFNRVLTSDEISFLYNGGYGRESLNDFNRFVSKHNRNIVMAKGGIN